jgi:dTDP-glucose 4,6-dehydratase
MKETVVITGVAGFIGSHLSETLLDRGYAVIGIDNLLTGDLANIAHLTGREFRLIKQDVTNYINLDEPVDFVLHWASPASPADYLNFPIPTLKVGALGTHNALGLALAKKATFVLASTSEVYGDPLEHPQTESYWGNVNPIGPRGVYDEAKRFAEAMTTAYHRYHGLETRIVRIFNTYGPRMRINDGRAVPNFIGQALRGEDVTVYGRGNQTRSFCYISDLVDGIIRLMHAETADPVNIGNPTELSIEQIARQIIEKTGSSSKIIYEPLPIDDPKVRKPDITRARALLDWEPRVSLDEGLTSTIDYFRRKSSAVIANQDRHPRPDRSSGPVEKPGSVSDVVKPRGQRHDQRRPDGHLDQNRWLAEVIEEERDAPGEDVDERRGLPQHGRAKREPLHRQVHDRHRDHDDHVTADDQHREPNR